MELKNRDLDLSLFLPQQVYNSSEVLQNLAKLLTWIIKEKRFKPEYFHVEDFMKEFQVEYASEEALDVYYTKLVTPIIGSRTALELAMRMVGLEKASIKEWFQNEDRAKIPFRLQIDLVEEEDVDFEHLIDLIYAVKNERGFLELVASKDACPDVCVYDYGYYDFDWYSDAAGYMYRNVLICLNAIKDELVDFSNVLSGPFAIEGVDAVIVDSLRMADDLSDYYLVRQLYSDENYWYVTCENGVLIKDSTGIYYELVNGDVVRYCDEQGNLVGDDKLDLTPLGLVKQNFGYIANRSEAIVKGKLDIIEYCLSITYQQWLKYYKENINANSYSYMFYDAIIYQDLEYFDSIKDIVSLMKATTDEIIEYMASKRIQKWAFYKKQYAKSMTWSQMMEVARTNTHGLHSDYLNTEISDVSIIGNHPIKWQVSSDNLPGGYDPYNHFEIPLDQHFDSDYERDNFFLNNPNRLSTVSPQYSPLIILSGSVYKYSGDTRREDYDSSLWVASEIDLTWGDYSSAFSNDFEHIEHDPARRISKSFNEGYNQTAFD